MQLHIPFKAWRHISFNPIALLCLLHGASAAIFSRECRQIAALNIDHSHTLLDATDELCTKRVCGSIPETHMKFSERLSPQCERLMDSYRSKWSRMGLSNVVTPHPCTTSKDTTRPQGPVLISSDYPTATFAMCTVPKIACTNFRKLLSTVMLHPNLMPTDSFSQFFNPHMWEYPSVWHYDVTKAACQTNSTSDGCSEGDKEVPDSLPVRFQASPEAAPEQQGRLPDSIPSFIVGRNPYVRVLSGFLDKMVHDPLRHDQWTFKSTNTNMGLDSDKKWSNTPEGFRAFVTNLAVRGVAQQDEHFVVASTLCSTSFRMDYYLRLEDMSQWFPCWMQGLGLRDFTEHGWTDSADGRMHVGKGEHWITERNPWRRDKDLRAAAVAAIEADILAESSRTDSSAEVPVGGFKGQGLSVPNGTVVGERGSAAKQLLSSDGRGDYIQAGIDVSVGSKSWKRLAEGDKCWWSPKGWACEEYYASFTHADGTVVPGLEGPPPATPAPKHAQASRSEGLQQFLDSKTRGLQGDQHDTDAGRNWQAYYDQETADLVFLMYADDFRAFGYERHIIA